MEDKDARSREWRELNDQKNNRANARIKQIDVSGRNKISKGVRHRELEGRRDEKK